MTDRPANPLLLFVSPSGRSGNPGTETRPFAALEEARDAVRRIRRERGLPPGGVTVLVAPGTYCLDRTLDLTAEDSGTESAPVTWRAASGGTVRLSGGRRITEWEVVRDPADLARLDESARGRVVFCDLARLGILRPGGLSRRGWGPVRPAHSELFFNGRRMTLARWPNEGFARITDVPPEGARDDGHGGRVGDVARGFHYEGDRPRRWGALSDVWAHGYWAWDWANSYEEVASIDTERRLVTLREPDPQYGFRPGQRFYFVNILAELDQPGEYYVDRINGRLYFWPLPEGMDCEAWLSLLEGPVVRMDGARHITLRGFTIEFGRSHGVEIVGGSACRVLHCTLRNLGNCGAVVSGGTWHGISGCEVCGTGDGGISLEGGDRTKLIAAEHFAENNRVHAFGQWSRCYKPGIGVAGVGNRVAANLIHDGPHNAIQLSGNDHIVEYNEIHSVCTESGDVGAFYMGRDWTCRGNVLRYNYFHDIEGVGMGAMGVYLDDCSSGVTIFGNAFRRVQRAVFIGGGRDNTVENNLFVDCLPAVWIDGRGLDKNPVWVRMVYETMLERLDAVKAFEPPYSERYPELLALAPLYARPDGIPPEGNRVVRNVFVRGVWLEVSWHAEREMVELRDNLIDVDPLFADESRGDLRLRRGSPAFAIGFQPIPWDRIGPGRDENVP